MNIIWKLGLAFLLLRLVAGTFLYLLQSSSPEAAHLVIVDVPTVLVIFATAFIFDWPHGITDGHDMTYHAFGLATWLSLGLLVGAAVQWRSGRTGA